MNEEEENELKLELFEIDLELEEESTPSFCENKEEQGKKRTRNFYFGDNGKDTKLFFFFCYLT